MKLYSIAKRFRIDRPDKFRLSAHDPAECYGLTADKKEAKAMLAEGIERLSELQERLYANDRWSVLIVLQAMDAAGKDSIIKHVMSGINPQGCEVHSFKQPSAEELQHDFLWRIAQRLPTSGRIGIFNRSHYEEVLTVRVHKELLARQKLPKQLVGKDIWQQRFDGIRAFERHLARNGTLILLDARDAGVSDVDLGPGAAPHGVIVGPDGAAWVNEGGQNAIARYMPTGSRGPSKVQLFMVPKADANLNTAVFDKQGTLWFTGQGGVIGRFEPVNISSRAQKKSL